MGDDAPEKALEEVQDGSHDSVIDQVAVVLPSQDALSSGPRVTFRGNSYDLISLVSLATGGLILFTCLTCNLGYYCMPIIPMALGLVGVLSAHQAVDARRTMPQKFQALTGVEVHTFQGPHPDGLVGTHISRIGPLRADPSHGVGARSLDSTCVCTHLESHHSSGST